MKSIIRLVALSATAIAMGFGAITASANLITTGITGSLTCTAASCGSGNLFTGSAGSFTGGLGKFVITASFGIDETLTLTFTNGTGAKQGLLTGTEMSFGGLQFADGSYLTDFTSITMTSNGSAARQQAVSALAIGSVVNDTINPNGSSFVLDFVDPAPQLLIGETITLTGKMVKMPEPGSLALLGAVLVAFGVVHIRRRTRS